MIKFKKRQMNTVFYDVYLNEIYIGYIGVKPIMFFAKHNVFCLDRLREIVDFMEKLNEEKLSK